MDDTFSKLAGEQRRRMEEAQRLHAEQDAERERQTRLETAWNEAFHFDAESFRELARQLVENGQAEHLGPIIESRRAALDVGDGVARVELVLLHLLQRSADQAPPTSEIDANLTAAREVWPDGLRIPFGNIHGYIENRARHGGQLPPEPTPKAEPKPEPAGEPEPDIKGVAPRDNWFWTQYHTRGTETYHRPSIIRDKWNDMMNDERAEICPEAPGQVTRDTVLTGIKRAQDRRDGKP